MVNLQENIMNKNVNFLDNGYKSTKIIKLILT